MQIILTPQESEEFFLSALCNGLEYISGHGLALDYEKAHYNKAKESLRLGSCYEDVLMQILRQGDALTLVDEESGDFSTDITLDMVHNRMSSVPITHLMNMYNEDDDAETADVIIQWVAYQEVIFG